MSYKRAIKVCLYFQFLLNCITFLCRQLQSPTCEHLCEPYAGQGFIDKFKVSACEYRRFEKCLEAKKDPRKCVGLAPKLGFSDKVFHVKDLFNGVIQSIFAGIPNGTRYKEKVFARMSCEVKDACDFPKRSRVLNFA